MAAEGVVNSDGSSEPTNVTLVSKSDGKPTRGGYTSPNPATNNGIDTPNRNMPSSTSNARADHDPQQHTAHPTIHSPPEIQQQNSTESQRIDKCIFAIRSPEGISTTDNANYCPSTLGRLLLLMQEVNRTNRNIGTRSTTLYRPPLEEES